MMDNEQIKTIDAEIMASSKDGRISCKVAQEIGDKIEVPYREVGKRCEKLNIKISTCQLGCF